jgi:hypothetical protein
MMADGTEQPIEDVEIGDFVLGANGLPNLVLGLQHPKLGDKYLFSLNGGTHFVTAEHPFLTTEGWKSIDPSRTAREVPGVETTPLRVGDRVLVTTARPTPGVCSDVLIAGVLQEVLLTSIEGRQDDPSTQLYNLTVDGDNAYIANGFAVHNY